MDRILYENYDDATGRSTEVSFIAEDGTTLFVTHQDARPIAESAKAIAANFDPHFHPKQDFVHVARISLAQWNRLSEMGITRDEKALNAWLDSREARQFRCDDGRKL